MACVGQSGPPCKEGGALMNNAQSEKNEIALEMFKLMRHSVKLTSGEITMLENACVAMADKYVQKATAHCDNPKEYERYNGYACKYRNLETMLGIERAQMECEVDKRTNLVYLRRQADKRRAAAAKRNLAKAGKAVAK